MDHDIVESVIKYQHTEKKIAYEQLIRHFSPQIVAKIINIISHINNNAPLIPSCNTYMEAISKSING